MTSYATTVECGRFAAHLETDDLGELVRDGTALDDLQALLDRHMVLHVSPQARITPEAIGRLAIHLGMPTDAAPRRFPPPVSPDYPFVADFSAPARAPSPTPRPPSYIETLHYDGISAYSMQATFDTPETTPNLWCDMRAAYERLPADLKAVVDERRALHAKVPPPGAALADFPALDRERARRRPLRIRHPRTGEPLLYLPKNPASVIEGLPDADGVAILHELWAHVEACPARYTAHAGHNQLFVWDGLGTTHTNPAFPRTQPLTLWFLVIPAATPAVEPWRAAG